MDFLSEINVDDDDESSWRCILVAAAAHSGYVFARNQYSYLLTFPAANFTEFNDLRLGYWQCRIQTTE